MLTPEVGRCAYFSPFRVCRIDTSAKLYYPNVDLAGDVYLAVLEGRRSVNHQGRPDIDDLLWILGQNR